MDVIDGGADSEGVMHYRAMAKTVAAMLVEIGTDKVAFEPYNEPAYYPCDSGGTEDWQRIMAGTVADIRSVSADLTIIATGACGGSITGLTDLDPSFDDANVLYSFHMYEPYAATSAPNMKRDKPYAYPGEVPFGEVTEKWDRKTVADYLAQPVDWAKQVGLPANRLVAGEFGCMRRWEGCKAYLDDVLTALDSHNLHWAFYSFREDSWDGMDYELGSKKVHWSYWEAIDAGKPDPVKRKATPEFEIIRKRL